MFDPRRISPWLLLWALAAVGCDSTPAKKLDAGAHIDAGFVHIDAAAPDLGVIVLDSGSADAAADAGADLDATATNPDAVADLDAIATNPDAADLDAAATNPDATDLDATTNPDATLNPDAAAGNPDAADLDAGLADSGVGIEIDYVVLQFPSTLTVAHGVASALIYGRIYEMGMTEAAGASPSVEAQVGYGPAASDPRSSGGWIWSAASYNAACSGCGNNDEYQAALTVPNAGSYLYTYRFSIDSGQSWTYADLDGAGHNAGLSFNPSMLGVLTVN